MALHTASHADAVLSVCVTAAVLVGKLLGLVGYVLIQVCCQHAASRAVPAHGQTAIMGTAR